MPLWLSADVSKYNTFPKVDGLLPLHAAGISVSGTYMGCYRDTGCDSANRLKTALVQSDPKLTVKRCLDLVLLAGWPYAGLAPGSNPGTSSCFGGDKLPAAAANPGCFAACAGNKTERCGDGNCQVSVYSGKMGREAQ
jgi:hypothetical protein